MTVPRRHLSPETKFDLGVNLNQFNFIIGNMKPEIHPKYEDTTFKCACGATIETGSTLTGEVKVEICSNCHPLYTGKAKMMDTAGRIERFNKKYQKK